MDKLVGMDTGRNSLNNVVFVIQRLCGRSFDLSANAKAESEHHVCTLIVSCVRWFLEVSELITTSI